MIVKFKTKESIKGGNNLSEFPRNWALTKFMDIFDIQGGTQPPKSTFKYEPRLGYVQLLQIRDFGERSLPTYILDTDNLKKCSEEDILIARYGASLGRILTGLSGAYNVAMAKVDIPEGMYNRFVYHLLRTEMFQAPLRLVSRSAQRGFNKLDLVEIVLPIAPFNEQKRIADKLDLLLAQVDACRSRLERIPQILERFRQSVLTAAISGELTEDWRTNHNLTVWENITLNEICLSISDGDHQAPPQVAEGIPFITIAAINDKRLSLTKATRFVPYSYFEKLKSSQKPQFGDILFSVTGSIAIPSLVNTNEPFTFQRHIAILKPNLSFALSKFLFYSLCSDNIKRQSIAVATGTAQKTIPLSKLREFVIALPSKDEQQEIIYRVDSLFSYAESLEAYYQKAYMQVNRLATALLDKAFRGELVPQNLNDEPASVLIEMIRQSRLTKPTTKIPKITMNKSPRISRNLHELVYKQFQANDFDVDALSEIDEWDTEDNREDLFQLLDQGILIMTKKDGCEGYRLKCVNKPAKEAL